ncbi:hypothetical protein [Bacillus testis]|uniref:hypothetical protein n=1 Tax=Bacillus testis TaxID=1622072 RepID=UPI00067F1292|nr:hypothetical protein [Bacillus testis]
MGRKKYYVMELECPAINYKHEIFSQKDALDCLEYNRSVSNDKWYLYKIWKHKGKVLSWEEIMPYK